MRLQALRMLISFIILESGDRHDDHLPKSNDGAKQQPDQIEPLGMQPVIRQLAEKEPQQDRRWNNESHFGIASEGNERVLCGGLRHAGNCNPVVSGSSAKPQVGDLKTPLAWVFWNQRLGVLLPSGL